MVALKLYTSVNGKPGELIDVVDMAEPMLIRFCYENWPERHLKEHDFDLPDHERQPPFEIQRHDGSFTCWGDIIPQRSEYIKMGDEWVYNDNEDKDAKPVTLDTEVSCQRCQSHRVADLSGKCSDLSFFTLGDREHDGYVVDEVGIGGGDYIEITYCLDCGQIQGEFPIPESPFERGEPV